MSRRAILLGLPAAAVVTCSSAAPAAAWSGDDYVQQGFKGLAAYVLPGDDAYSRRQGVTRPSAGGVGAGTAAMLADTYDKAVQVSVAPGLGIRAPGAGGLATVLDLMTRATFPLSMFGPFANSFANLSFRQKGVVLGALDRQSLLQASPLGYAFGTLVTLAALGAYSEFGVIAGKKVSSTPIGWTLSRYGGVSDGWPELIGYWGGRRAAADPDGKRVGAAHA